MPEGSGGEQSETTSKIMSASELITGVSNLADRRVTATGKNEDGDLVSLCNAGEYWSPRSSQDAIRDIESGAHTYHVGTGTNRTDVHVVDDAGGKYLRTDPDTTQGNNLDDLPDC